ncbi:unnamed protein product, partial [Ectocarpus sp. 4 AP-2014]
GGGGGGRVAGRGLGGARSAGAGGSVVGLLTLGTAEEAVESRVRRGLLGEALDLATACGLDAGGVRAGLWRRAVEGGSLSEDDVQQHLAGVSDHRWVVKEALAGIGLAATEPAASAILGEGLRRCDFLFSAHSRRGESAAAVGGGGPAEVRPTASGGDGWDFDDDADDDGDLGDAPRAAAATAAAAAVEHGSSIVLAGGGGAAGGSGGGRDGGGGAVATVGLGSAGDEGESEVRRLRARLMTLRYLLDTFLVLEGEQGRGFDVGGLREFLGLAGAGDSGAAERAWEDFSCRRDNLRRSLMGFARKGEASAVGVLMERHPLETLPARLEALSALPETLDPRSYASLLPCCWVVAPTASSASAAGVGSSAGATPPPFPLFFRARETAAGAGEGVPPAEAFPVPRTRPQMRENRADAPTVMMMMTMAVQGRDAPFLGGQSGARCPLTPLCEADADGTAASSGKDDGGSNDQEDVFFVEAPGASDADKIATAAERQRDSAALAAWYAGRARELDARAGQLRHATTLCRFGARRVVVSSGGRAGGDVTEGQLERLDLLLQHLTSLVYAGSVSPSVTLAAWESMGLEERMSAVLSASSVGTIADDVRSFASAAAVGGSGGASGDDLLERPREQEGYELPTFQAVSTAVPPRLEGVMVRVLGTLVKAAPSAERMEACAAVAKASRPEVPENDRLIRKPEALLTLLLDACYAWAETAPDTRAMEAAWNLLECVPTRQPNVDASLQDRVDALEGHLYATQVLQTYGLALPLTRYLEMGGGAEGTTGRDAERYNAFARGLVDQMCAVTMDRAGMGSTDHSSGGGGGSSKVGRILQRGAKIVGGGGRRAGGGGVVLDGVGREAILRLHKDVSRLQSNAWQGLGTKWAIRRVLQAVVEGGQFDVARALVESSVAPKVGAGGREGGEDDGRAGSPAEDETEGAKRQERRSIAEDVLLSAATAHFNAAPSFEDGEEASRQEQPLRWAQRWLDLLPWSSRALDRERSLHDAGRLAHDLGAVDLVPLQLRLRLCDRDPSSASGSVGEGERWFLVVAAADGAMGVIQEVLRCNPDSFRDGGGSALEEGGDGGWGGEGKGLFGAGKGGLIRTPPGTGLMRLAGLLGLTSGEEIDRVRALVARAALEAGDGGAACDILSVAILRRPPRGRRRGEEDGGTVVVPFAPELCEALDLVVKWGGSGAPRVGTAATGARSPARTADLCAQALSRCPASQIGRLLGPWSRFEAIRYLAGAAAAATPTADSDGAGVADGAGGSPCAGGGSGGPAAVASVLVGGGMDERAAASVERSLVVGFQAGEGSGSDDSSSWLDRRLGVGGGAAEGALRLLLLREHDSCLLSPFSRDAAGDGDGAATKKTLEECAGPTEAAEAAAALDDLARREATSRLCILLALAELRLSEEEEEARASDTAGSQKQPSSSAYGSQGGSVEIAAAAAGPGAAAAAREAADEFGVGAVERAVGYALAAADGRAALGALRALLERAEARVMGLREDAEAAAAEDRGGAGGGRRKGADDEAVVLAAATIDPDESLVQALGKRGISSNRARRACVATRNASREAALAWCVEHSGDPAMDAPFISSRRSPPAPTSGRQSSEVDGGSGSSGGDGRMRAAMRSRDWAAAALEAYVHARLAVVNGDTGGGGGGVVEAVLPAAEEEMEELLAVITSFRQRQSLGLAEEKARGVLPATVDLGRFAGDPRYRQ